MKWEKNVNVISKTRSNHFLIVIIHKELHCVLAMSYKFTLQFVFRKYIVIITIWIDNSRIVLTNLKKVVRKERGTTNRIIKKSKEKNHER